MADVRYLRRIRLEFAYPESTKNLVLNSEEGKTELLVGFDLEFEAAFPFPSGKIWVNNLSDRTVRDLSRGNLGIRISVGYVGRPILALYSGSVRRLEQSYDPPETETIFYVGPPRGVYRNVEIGSRGRTRIVDLIRKSFDLMGLTYSAQMVTGILGNRQTEKGYSFSGPVHELVSELLLPNGLYWTISAESSVSIYNASYLAPSGLFEISDENGLVGVPQFSLDDEGRIGLSVTTLCNPRLKLDRAIKMKTEYVDPSAVFRPISIRHSGNNWDDLYVTDMDLRLQAGNL